MLDCFLPQKQEVLLFKDVEYSVPGLFLFSNLIFRLNEIVSSKFSQTLPVKYLYGSPVCIWNGGRLLLNKTKQKFDEQSLLSELKSCISHKIVPLITFSNMLITENDLSDRIGNFILKAVSDFGGEVIVANEILKKYINNTYPNIKLHASVLLTVYNERSARFYINLSKQYQHFVVHPDDNFNLDLLDIIPKSNAEILVNERCGLCCTIRQKHYESIAKDQIDFVNGCYEDQSFLSGCKFIPENKQAETKLRNISLSIDEVAILVNKGFKLIKLQGRADNFYSFFFDLLRYTLEPKIAFPTIFPIFTYFIEDYMRDIHG
ncbi:MAG: hypothetical protein ACTTI6_03720 [Treponema sp.]|uniref:hypothetical protein n=1 Tax=Treponema sp. TaxID=166 RepID=UPI003FA2C56F